MTARRNTDGGVSRRGFMAAGVAAAAATVVPMGVDAAPAAVTWQDRLSGLPALQAAYRAEVVRLATALRPRFESGELHGWHYFDDPNGKDTDESDRDHPTDALSNELAESHVPDDATAFLILACSRAAEEIPQDSFLGAIRAAAADCIVIDVYGHARAQGWWRPVRGEHIGQSEWRALWEADHPGEHPVDWRHVD